MEISSCDWYPRLDGCRRRQVRVSQASSTLSISVDTKGATSLRYALERIFLIDDSVNFTMARSLHSLISMRTSRNCLVLTNGCAAVYIQATRVSFSLSLKMARVERTNPRMVLSTLQTTLFRMARGRNCIGECARTQSFPRAWTLYSVSSIVRSCYTYL